MEYSRENKFKEVTNANRRRRKVFHGNFGCWRNSHTVGILAMGYRTSNEESHVCTYCDKVVGVGQGVLIKYYPAQSDESIISSHFTNRIGHEQCVKQYGSKHEQESLI
jgi:hypothetical protein